MTYTKVLKQIKNKKGRVSRFMKHCVPTERKFGKNIIVCRRCGRRGRGIIRKYGLMYCRQCFREIGRRLGFEKFS